MITRRRLLAATAGTGLATMTASCAAPAVVPAVTASVAGAASSSEWFEEFSKGIAAELATKAVEAGQWVFNETWKSWQEPSENVVKKAEKDDGLKWHSHEAYGHLIPGTSLFAILPTNSFNSATDRLACVRDNGENVVLEHWAWKAILAYTKVELDGKADDAYLNHLQLLMGTLMPQGNGTAGTSPKGTAKWITYPAKEGEVEIVTFPDVNKPKVSVTATGLFTKTPGTPKMRTFELV